MGEMIVDTDLSYLYFDKEEGKLIFGTREYTEDPWSWEKLNSPQHHRLYMQLKAYWEVT